MYYNINRILVDEKFQGQKWYSGVICDLIPQSNSVIVFDVTSKVWKFQPLASWNSYLVSIGNLKLAPFSKLSKYLLLIYCFFVIKYSLYDSS